MKKWIVALLKAGLACGLIFWLIQSGRFDPNQLKKIADPRIWLFGLCFMAGAILCVAKRWQYLLSLEGIQLSYERSLRLNLIGVFFNYFVPGGVGGDVVKAGYLVKENSPKKWFVAWSIVVDRAYGMLALISFSGIVGLFYSHKLPPPLANNFFNLSCLIVGGIFVFFMLIVFLPSHWIERIMGSNKKIESVLNPLYFFFRRPQKTIFPMAVSFLGQSMALSVGGTVLFFLNPDIPLYQLLLIFPFGFLATILPISPGGLGVGQMAFYHLFEEVAQNGEFGVLVITFYQAVQFIIGLSGGALFVLNKAR